MLDQTLSIDFVYEDSNSHELSQEHEGAINHGDDFEAENGIIRSDLFDDLEIVTYDVIDDKWFFEDLEDFGFHDGDSEFDLTNCSLVEYTTKSHDQLLKYWEASGGISVPDVVDQLVALSRIGYEATESQPVAVFSQTPDHSFRAREIGRPPITAESLAKHQLTYLPWLTILTPEMVELYGREVLLSSPAWTVEELDGGAILVVCHDDVLDWNADCRAVAEHNGLPSYEELYS